MSIRRAVETVAGSFNLTVVNGVDGQDWNILTLSPCEIKIGKDTVLTGYIDEIAGTVDADSRSIRITGRDKTCDLVDCCALHDKSSWSNLDIKQLCEVFTKPFGINVVMDAPLGKKFVAFSINKGDTAFQCVEKACRLRSMLPTTDGKGNLVLSVAGTRQADDKLILGQNILMAEATFNMENRFSLYRVFSENTGDPILGWGTESISAKGDAEDLEIKTHRYRPIMLQAESQSTSAECKTRAKWESMVRAGASKVLRIKVAGWRQSTGKIWESNHVTYVKIPHLNVDCDMLISEVDLQKGDEGTIAQLSLKRVDAYNPGTRFKTGSSTDFKSVGDKKTKAEKHPILGW